MAGHVVNPSTKFEYPTAICSWVLSSDICRRIPLTMRLQPLRMRRITWPMHRGKFFPHIWNLWPRFAYSLYNFYVAMIKRNWVICQDNVWPCAKDHTSLCACAKSRQHWTLPPSFSVTTISRELIQILEIWQHLGQLLVLFSLRMRRNGYLWIVLLRFQNVSCWSVSVGFAEKTSVFGSV